MISLRHPATRVLASSLATQAALVVSGPLVVRLLGVEGRGETAFVFATVLLVSQVGPWGLPQAWSYFIARGDVDPRTLLDAYLGRYLRQSVIAALIGASALVAAALATDNLSNPVGCAIIALAAIAILMLAVLVLACLQGAHKFNELAILQAIPGIGYTCAVVILALIGHASVILVLALYFSGWLVIGLLGLWLLRREPRRDDADVPSLHRLRAYGRRSLVSASAPIDNLGIDQISVGLLLSHHDLGLYVIGLAFESGPVLVLIALASVCTPVVASMADPVARRAYCIRWLRIGVGVGLLAVAATEGVIDPLLIPAFGEEAAAATTPARILVVAGLFLGLRRMAGGMLQGCGRPRDATYAETAGFVTMLGLMVALTPRFGLEGACVALLGGGAVTFVSDVVLLLRSSAPRAAHESP